MGTSLAQLKIGLKISFGYKGAWSMLMVPDCILEGLGQVENLIKIGLDYADKP